MASAVTEVSVFACIDSLQRIKGSLLDMTAFNQRLADAVTPIYAGFIPTGHGRDPHPGLMRGSARGRAGRRLAFVFVGGSEAGVEYAGPITFGWRAHGIEPHRWDVAGSAAAGPVARSMYEVELDRIILTVQ
jgi:hypothetical protein